MSAKMLMGIIAARRSKKIKPHLAEYGKDPSAGVQEHLTQAGIARAEAQQQYTDALGNVKDFTTARDVRQGMMNPYAIQAQGMNILQGTGSDPSGGPQAGRIMDAQRFADAHATAAAQNFQREQMRANVGAARSVGGAAGARAAAQANAASGVDAQRLREQQAYQTMLAHRQLSIQQDQAKAQLFSSGQQAVANAGNIEDAQRRGDINLADLRTRRELALLEAQRQQQMYYNEADRYANEFAANARSNFQAQKFGKVQMGMAGGAAFANASGQAANSIMGAFGGKWGQQSQQSGQS